MNLDVRTVIGPEFSEADYMVSTDPLSDTPPILSDYCRDPLQTKSRVVPSPASNLNHRDFYRFLWLLNIFASNPPILRYSYLPDPV